MQVLGLPTDGCNILVNQDTVYNYHSDGHTRDTYIIFDGVPHLSSSSYSQYGYAYTGTCLAPGELVYKPEYREVFFPLLAVCVSLAIFWFAYKLMVSMWWRKR